MGAKVYDDETLMAFADGVLDDRECAEIEAALAVDPVLAARVAGLAEARVAVRDLYAPLADLPVPPALAARVAEMAADAERRAPASAPANVVDLAGRRDRRSFFRRVLPAVAAASVAALVAGPLGYALAPDAEPDGLAIGAPVPKSVAATLDRLPSGSTSALAGFGALQAIATFHDGDGHLCREFELDGSGDLVAVACRTDGAWRVTFAVETRLADGYVPAGASAALEAYLAAESAGEPLTPEAEAKALGGS